MKQIREIIPNEICLFNFEDQHFPIYNKTDGKNIE